MAQVRVRWGRVLMFLLLLTSGIGYATFPMWQDRLTGTPLEPLPGMLADAVQEGRALTSALWSRFFGAELSSARVLPEDTLVLLTTQRLGDAVQVLAPLLSDEPSSDLLATVKKALTPSNPDHQTLRARLEAFESIGIDQSRPFCMALVPVHATPRTSQPSDSGTPAGAHPELAIIGLVPVQSSDALSAFEHVMEREGHSLRPVQLAGERALELSDGSHVLIWNRHLLFILGQGTTAFDGLSSTPVSSSSDRMGNTVVEPLLAHLNHPGKTLSDNDTFTSLLKAHGDDWHLLMWGAIGSSLARLVERDEPSVAASLRAVDGSALAALHLSDKRLRLRTAVGTRLADHRTLLSEKPDPSFLEQISGRPIAVGTAGVNLQTALAQLKADPNAGEVLDKLERQLQEDAQISLYQDLLPAFRGTGGMVVLEGQDVPDPGSVMNQLLQAAGRQLETLAGVRWPVNGLIWLDIKDDAVLKRLLPHLPLQADQENLTVKQEQDSLGTWVDGGIGGIGITRTHVLLTIGPGVLARTRAQLGEGQVPKADQCWTMLDQDIRTQLERKDPAYFYLDLTHAIQVATDFPAAKIALSAPRTSALKDMVKATVRGFSSRSWLEGEIWMSEYMLLAPENGLAAEASRFRQAAARLTVP